MPQKLKKALSQAKALGLEWIGLRNVHETAWLHHVRDSQPFQNSVSKSNGVMIEVLAQGQFGYAATSQANEESLHQAILRAADQAKRAAAYAIFTFKENARPPVQGQYSSPVKKPLTASTPAEWNGLLIQICDRLKSAGSEIVRTEASVELVEREVHFVSSNGSDTTQSFSWITMDFSATAQNGPITQMRSDGGFRGRSYQGGLEFLEKDSLWERVTQVGEQAKELVYAPECPEITTDLVLKPDQMMLQIHESIGHPLELDRILGDERNYAGWSFVKPNDFGKLVYGSPLLNVTFDPTIAHQFASYRYDDAGVEAKKEFLIRDGLLVRALGGIESQLRSGIPGVANLRSCTWNRPPIDRMANINIEAGTSSLGDILSSVERGVIMETNRSWSIDDFRNKFQFGCEYAKLIENGKTTKTVRNPNYRGVTVPFWKNLKAVGKPEAVEVYGTPNCGKGEPNQVIRVGHASPPCLFSGVEVFGGSQ